MKNRRCVPIAIIALTMFSTSVLAQAGKVLDRLPFEVIMDITWRGQDIQIRKVLSCDKRRRLHPGNITNLDEGLKMREVWDQSAYRTYHVLPSREVLIIVAPPVCSPFNKWINPLPDGYLPIMYWVDNADAPKVGEQIVYSRYFTANPYRRFEIRRFQVVEARHLTDKIDDDQRLVWLFRSSAVKRDAYFVGASAVAIPKPIWSQYPALAAELSKYTESGTVDRSLVQQTARILLESCQAEALGIGPAEKCLVGPFDDRPLVISASPISEGLWRLDYEDAGVERYVRHIDADQLDQTGCNPSFVICNLYKGTYRLEIDGKLYELPKSGGKLVFDAKKQVLLRLRFGFVSSTFNYIEGASK